MDSDAATRLAALCGYPGGAASATRLCGLWAGMGSIYEIRCCTGAGGGGGSGGLALGCMMESRQSRIVCSGKPTANLICTLQLTDPGLP